MATSVFPLPSRQFRRIAPLLSLIAILLFFAIPFAYFVFIEPGRSVINSQIRTDEPTLRIMELDPGRFRLSSKEAKHVHIQFDTIADAKYLMIRAENSHLKIGKETVSDKKRHFIPLIDQGGFDIEATPFVIDEIGLVRELPHSKLNKQSAKVLLILIFGLIGTAGVFLHSLFDKKQASVYGSIYFFVFTVSFYLGVLFVLFSPDWSHDLKILFASGTLEEPPGCNLNYGLHMASSILQGKGPLISNTVPWCRMPGYGYIISLAGNAHDLLQMAIHAVCVQLLLFAASLSLFFWASLRITKPWAAAVIATAIALLPQFFFRVQIESIMPAVILCSLSICCLFAAQLEKSSFWLHLLFHLSFAFWFFLRTDILPAWAVISLVLYVKNRSSWKYLLIPVCLVLAIGVPWALFKLPHIGEFSMTTESVGFSMMAGLWEIPHKFIWEPTDQSVFEWLGSIGINPCTKSGSYFAAKEVFRFCFTFPVYTLSLIWHKFLIFAKTPIGKLGFLPWIHLFCLTVMVLAIFTKYRVRLILLLAWPIFLNVPVFFIFYSSEGRFYHAPSICLFAACLLLLLDPAFYRNLYHYRTRAISIVITMFLIIFLGPRLDEYLINNEPLRYCAPFLDPKLSTLNIPKKI